MKTLRDPADLIAERERLQREIATLRTELNALQDKIDTLPVGRELWAVRLTDENRVWIFTSDPNILNPDTFDRADWMTAGRFRERYGFVPAEGKKRRVQWRVEVGEETRI